MTVEFLQGDSLELLGQIPQQSQHCVVTSPPYWSLRSYLSKDHVDKTRELGSEKVPFCKGWESGPRCGECYVCHMVEVSGLIRKVLREEGTFWLNLGDCYNDKNLNQLPSRVAIALQTDGWYLRQEITWAKTSPMPQSVRDRPTSATEKIYLFSKSANYYYDIDAERVRHTMKPQRRPSGRPVDEIPRQDGQPKQSWSTTSRTELGVDGHPDGRNLWNWWEIEPSEDDNIPSAFWKIGTEPLFEQHFAAFPSELARRCVSLGTSYKGCCSKCGAPWVRQVDRERISTRPGTDSKVYIPDPAKKQDALNDRTKVGFNQRCRESRKSTSLTGGAYLPPGQRMHYNARNSSVVGNRDPLRHCTVSTTVGWEPSCECKDVEEPVPCTVCDPFSGAGTTALVCKRLGRNFLGIELNQDNIELSKRRLRDVGKNSRKPIGDNRLDQADGFGLPR